MDIHSNFRLGNACSKSSPVKRSAQRDTSTEIPEKFLPELLAARDSLPEDFPTLLKTNAGFSGIVQLMNSGWLVALCSASDLEKLFGGKKVSTVINNIPEGARSVLIKLCNDRLADAVDLQLQCKHAYWNTIDPDLVTLRELFDELNESVEDHLDRIAERAVEMGGVANSPEHVVATWPHALCSPDAICRNHAPTIAAALGSFGFLTRHAVDTCNELGDAVSAQLFTTISQDIDKWQRTLAAL